MGLRKILNNSRCETYILAFMQHLPYGCAMNGSQKATTTTLEFIILFQPMHTVVCIRIKLKSKKKPKLGFQRERGLQLTCMKMSKYYKGSSNVFYNLKFSHLDK